MTSTILLVFSFVCFLLAAWRHASPEYNRLMAAGLTALVGASLFVR